MSGLGRILVRERGTRTEAQAGIGEPGAGKSDVLRREWRATEEGADTEGGKDSFSRRKISASLFKKLMSLGYE